jgi:hypothetical protein
VHVSENDEDFILMLHFMMCVVDACAYLSVLQTFNDVSFLYVCMYIYIYIMHVYHICVCVYTHTHTSIRSKNHLGPVAVIRMMAKRT